MKFEFILIVVCFCFTSLQSANAESLPNIPNRHVIDDSKVLGKAPKNAIEELLIKHEQLTGQGVYVAVFGKNSTGKLSEISPRIFQNWLSQLKKDQDLVLLSTAPEEARIDSSYSLDALLPPKKSEEIVSQFVSPELRRDHTDRALFSGIIQILTQLQSPLIESGKIQEVLKQTPEFSSLLNEDDSGPEVWMIALLLGTAALSATFWIRHKRKQDMLIMSPMSSTESLDEKSIGDSSSDSNDSDNTDPPNQASA